MTSYNDKRRKVQKTVLLTAISTLIDNRRWQLFKKKQVKRFWRRSLIAIVDNSKNYHLYLQLRKNSEFYYRYLQMSEERFDHLLGLVCNKITKKDTPMRDVITAD